MEPTGFDFVQPEAPGAPPAEPPVPAPEAPTSPADEPTMALPTEPPPVSPEPPEAAPVPSFTVDAPPRKESDTVPGDRPVYESAETQGRFFGFAVETPPPVDIDLADNQVVEVGAIKLDVLHTPGHCPGHVCFHAAAEGVLFSGDLLFQRSIGRTDLPGGDVRLIKASLDRLASDIPAETVVYPGHMGSTTMEQEKRFNPFLGGAW